MVSANSSNAREQLCHGLVRMVTWVWTVLVFLTSTAALVAQEADFTKDVLPIFRKYCNGCHNAREKEGGLILEDFAHAQLGGDSGPAIVAGKLEDSELWRRLTAKDDSRMPPVGHLAPKPQELRLIRNWIEAGAKPPEGGLSATGLVTPRIEPKAPVREPITSLACDPQGRWLAVARPNVVQILSWPQRELVAQLTGHTGAIAEVQFDRTGQTLVVAAGENGLSGEATLWNTADWSRICVLSGHRDALYSAQMNLQGDLVATASYDREIRLWQLKPTRGSQPIQPWRVLTGHNDAVFSLAFHPAGRLLASASGDRTVKLWDVTTGQRLDTFAQPAKEQYSVAISPDGRYVAAGGVDMRVRVWEITQNGQEGTNPLLYARFAHEGPILKVVFSPDGRLLVSASEDRRIKIWETKTFTQAAWLERQPDWPAALAFSADGSTLFVGRMNGELASYEVNPLWAEGTRDLQPLSETPGFENDVTTPLASPMEEVEPNDALVQAQRLDLPAQVHGRFWSAPRPEQVQASVSPEDVDLYRFEAKRGQVWILETQAARSGSPADTKLEILDDKGRPVQRALLQAVRDSWINFRPIDSSQVQVRVEFWEEMDLNQLLYMNGEIGKFFRAPRGPDSGYDFYDNRGKRRTYFDTTAIAHAKDEPVYIVEAYPPGSNIVDNGLPVFPLYFVNDDDGERELGTDSRLTFTAPSDGTYFVRVTDSRGFSGEQFTYQLVIRQPRPDFVVRLDTPNVKVPAGSGQRLQFSVDRIDNFDGEIRIDILNVPAGYQVATPTVIEAGHLVTYSALTAQTDAPSHPQEVWDAVVITATAIVRGETVVKQVGSLGEVKLEKPALIRVFLLPDDLTYATPDGGLVMQPGTTITAKIRVERHGYDGDVKFDVDNLPHGIIVDNIGLSGVLVRANETERQIFLTARPWVPETTRWISAVAQGQGNQASVAIPLHVRRQPQVAGR